MLLRLEKAPAVNVWNICLMQTSPHNRVAVKLIVYYYCCDSISAPLLSAPLFGGSAAIEWITLSSSGVSVADSRGSAPRILQRNDSTIPRWVHNKHF